MVKRKKRVKKGFVQDILEFDAVARARGLSYGQAQVEETCRDYQYMRQVPAHYRKAGTRF